jgi:NAD(P)-dependent dehydrogenase (short-subunit alcohol dehydrogenase family)
VRTVGIAVAAIEAVEAANGPARIVVNCAGIAAAARALGREKPIEQGRCFGRCLGHAESKNVLRHGFDGIFLDFPGAGPKP